DAWLTDVIVVSDVECEGERLWRATGGRERPLTGPNMAAVRGRHKVNRGTLTAPGHHPQWGLSTLLDLPGRGLRQPREGGPYRGSGHDHVRHDHRQGVYRDPVRRPRQGGDALHPAQRHGRPAEVGGREYGRREPADPVVLAHA